MDELKGLMIIGMPSVSINGRNISSFFPVTRELPKIPAIVAGKDFPESLKTHPFEKELKQLLGIDGVIAFATCGKAFLLDYNRYMGNGAYDHMVQEIMQILRSLDLTKLPPTT